MKKINLRKLGRETAKTFAVTGIQWAAMDAVSTRLMPLAKGKKGGVIAAAVATAATGLTTGYVVRDALDKLDDIIIVKKEMEDIPLDDEEDFNFEEEECE